MPNRQIDLLGKAATALMAGEDPLAGSFLREHDVTLDEAYDLADQIAQAVRIYLLLRKERPSMLAELVVAATLAGQL